MVWLLTVSIEWILEGFELVDVTWYMVAGHGFWACGFCIPVIWIYWWVSLWLDREDIMVYMCWLHKRLDTWVRHAVVWIMVKLWFGVVWDLLGWKMLVPCCLNSFSNFGLTFVWKEGTLQISGEKFNTFSVQMLSINQDVDGLEEVDMSYK
jgi:hypothetical protein